MFPTSKKKKKKSSVLNSFTLPAIFSFYSLLFLLRQRELAAEYGFEVLDLRNEFEETENYESKYLRPNNDGVHFTKVAAQYVAERVWDIAEDLRF